MNMVQLQDTLKQLADGQLIKELNQPTGMAPSFLVLGELKRRKDLRSTTTSGPEPQGSMAEEYTQGLMSQGPSNLYSALGQARATGEPVGYGTGQVQAFADGGEVLRRRQREHFNRFNPEPLPEEFPYSRRPSYEERLRMILRNSRLPGPMSYPPGEGYPDPREGEGLGQVIPEQGYDYPKTRRQISQEDSRGRENYENPLWVPPNARDDRRPLVINPNVPTAQAPPPVGPGDFGGLASVYPNPTEAVGIGQAIAPVPSDDALVDPGGATAGAPRGRGGGGGAAGGGGGAGRGGPQGLADFMAQVRALGLPDRYGELSLENQNEKEALKRSLEGDKGMAILQAGLGILKGTSPFAGPNLAGASEGVRYWQDAKKENRMAMQGLRQADQQIAIAQANRDEKQLESALKMKMHWEETLQRSADRQAAAGNAAADRAANREERAADRKEAMMLREQSIYITNMNEYRQEIKGLDAMLANPLISEEQKKVFMEQRQEAAENLRSANNKLRQLQGERDKRVGRPTDETPKATPKPTLRYNPATGKVEPIK